MLFYISFPRFCVFFFFALTYFLDSLIKRERYHFGPIMMLICITGDIWQQVKVKCHVNAIINNDNSHKKSEKNKLTKKNFIVCVHPVHLFFGRWVPLPVSMGWHASGACTEAWHSEDGCLWHTFHLWKRGGESCCGHFGRGLDLDGERRQIKKKKIYHVTKIFSINFLPNLRNTFLYSCHYPQS